jgi:hypothetical protein
MGFLQSQAEAGNVALVERLDRHCGLILLMLDEGFA